MSHAETCKLTTLSLTAALHTTVVSDPAGIENLTLLESLGGAQRLGASSLGNTTTVAEASHGRGEGGEDSDDAGSVHVGGCRRDEVVG